MTHPLASSHCSSSAQGTTENGVTSPPSRPRAPDRLLRSAAVTAGAAPANAERATGQLAAPGASSRQPATRAHRHSTSGPDHSAPGPDHSSPGSHNAAPGADNSTSGPHHAASVPTGVATARSHHSATVSPGKPAARSRHPATVSAHGATSRHAPSTRHPAATGRAHAGPERGPDSPARGDTGCVPQEPQDAEPRRRDVPGALALARGHADERRLGCKRARGRLRHGGGVGGRGPRRLALSSRLRLFFLSSLVTPMLSPPPRASTLLLAPFQFHLFFFLWCCYLILPALRSILDVRRRR
uniref:Uncharacterized protein n=1 Tax=Zea mays TaxID=4577 RepID=A0A804PLU8_MAIZE